jgi:hypothetical protein
VSLVGLVSAKHSPGVTTAAVALSSVWPTRAALVLECDPAGGDLAALTGLSLEPGLTSLAAAQRHGLTATDFAAHAQRLPSGAHAVLAPPSGERTCAALSALSDRLGRGLARMDDTDALVDCGRFDPVSPVGRLMEMADLILLVVRPTLAGVEHAASRLEHLRASCPSLGLLLVGDRPYPAQEVASYLTCPVLGVLADDPPAAESLLSALPSPRLARSLLVRSARSIAEAIVLRLPSEPRAQEPSHQPVACSANPRATAWPGQR